MPGFDGTGPFGAGAMTGGRRGYCISQAQNIPYGQAYETPVNRSFCRPRFGLGLRRGWGGWSRRGCSIW